MRARWQTLMNEYGPVALATYFVIFGVVLAGFMIAILAGVTVEGAAGGAGSLAAAYVATKLTQPLRIAATLVLTPFVARLVRWWRGPAAKRSAQS